MSAIRPRNSLVHVDQQGRVEPVSRFKDAFLFPRYSPDGRRIVYTTSTKEQRVWIYDLEREAREPVTASEGACGFPIWTPDGKKVVFSWIKSYREDIRWQAVDGGSPMQPLLSGDKDQVPGSFSPDGSTLAFLSYDPKTADDILLLDMKTGAVKPFLQTGAREIYPEFSPDGRWLAYVQQEPRRQEVWVSSYPAGEGRWQVSVNGGAEPIWSRDGKQLFYRQADKVLVADIRTEHGFSASKPRLLFDIPGFMTSGPTRSWDLAPDGRSFLMVKLEEAKPEPATEILFIQNWFEELKRLVSTGKR